MIEREEEKRKKEMEEAEPVFEDDEPTEEEIQKGKISLPGDLYLN